MADPLKVKVDTLVDRDGVIIPLDEEGLHAKMEGAGWTDDPGRGKAVLLPDGSELLNPRPFAPPVDYDTSPDAFTLWQQQLQRMANIRDLGNLVLDESEEDADDFDVDDPEDIYVRSEYELVLQEEAPAIPGSSKGPVESVSPEEARREALLAEQAADNKAV